MDDWSLGRVALERSGGREGSARLLLVGTLLGGSLSLTPPVLASGIGAATAPSAGVPFDATTVTLQGRLDVLEGDDFTHGRTIDTYELVTDQGSYELSFGRQEPEVAASGSFVTVRGALAGSTITVAANGLTVAASGAAATAGPAITGAKRLAVILINFSDNTSQPFTPAFAAGVAFTNADSAATYYSESSWGKVTLSGDVFGWYTLPNTSETCDWTGWANAADAAAAAAGVNLGTYDYREYAFPYVSSCTWVAGEGQVFGPLSWSNGEMDNRVMAHELGHNFGLAHASGYICIDAGQLVALSATTANCTSDEYGDPFSVMGSSPPIRGLTNFERGRLGWLTAANTLDITTTGVYTLAPVEQYNPTGVQALRIAHGSSSYEMLEFRQPYGTFDSFSTSDPVVNGVTVRLVPSYDTYANTQIIDTTLWTLPGATIARRACVPTGSPMPRLLRVGRSTIRCLASW